jgi:hypothetical protein
LLVNIDLQRCIKKLVQFKFFVCLLHSTL